MNLIANPTRTLSIPTPGGAHQAKTAPPEAIALPPLPPSTHYNPEAGCPHECKAPRSGGCTTIGNGLFVAIYSADAGDTAAQR